MRTFSLTLIVAMTLIAAAGVTRVHAAADVRADPAPAISLQQQVDQHDDTRVAVQLAVLGAAAVVVVVLGTGAYFLRKKLGLVAPPPKQDGAGHH
jgi:hypothetical protein